MSVPRLRLGPCAAARRIFFFLFPLLQWGAHSLPQKTPGAPWTATQTVSGLVDEKEPPLPFLVLLQLCVCTLEEQGHNIPLWGTDRYTATSLCVCSAVERRKLN